MTKQELEAKIARWESSLAKTTDEKQRSVMQGSIDKLKKQLEDFKEETPAPEPKVEKKPVKVKVEKKEKPAKAEKPEKKAKPAKKDKAAKKEKKAKATKPEKEVEKTVKISKVMPVEDKNVVKDILENEHYKVIIKEVGGKKVKISVKNSDRVVAKNKIDSAFTTIAKKVVDSEDERKKYADDIKALDTVKSIVTEIVEHVYKAFNAHKTEELKAILKKLKSF
jgi:outer membrane biosynthesis protein TonB